MPRNRAFSLRAPKTRVLYSSREISHLTPEALSLGAQKPQSSQESVQNQSQRGETMTRRLVSGAVAGLVAAAFAGGAVEAVAQTKGYVTGNRAVPDQRRLRLQRLSDADRWRREERRLQQHRGTVRQPLLPHRLLDAGHGDHPVRPRSRAEAARRRRRPRRAAAAAAACSGRPRRRRRRPRQCRRSRWRRRPCSTSTRPC